MARTCTKCLEEKPLDAFNRESKNKTPGLLQSRCRECRKKMKKNYDDARRAHKPRRRLGPKPTPIEVKFWPCVKRTDGRWLWGGLVAKDGYGKVNVARRPTPAHRVSWILHNGDIPKGMLVCHRCDVRNCVNPDHLFLGTHKDNTRDMMQKGRWRYGGSPKVSDDAVREIRLRCAGGASYNSVSKQYGLSREQVRRICLRIDRKRVV